MAPSKELAWLFPDRRLDYARFVRDRAAAHFVGLPWTVIRKRKPRELTSARTVVPRAGVQPNGIDVGLLAQNVENCVDSFIHE